MTCIIIEDEIPAQNLLKSYLQKLPNVKLVNTFNAAIKANAFLKEEDVDVVFLDINLPDISGIDFIKTVNNAPAIIITTAYPDYAVSSFELDTIVDYLVKPFGFDRFIKAINKAEKYVKQPINIPESSNENTLFLNVDKTHHKIIINNILYIESDRNYITVVTKTQKLSYLESLKNWKNKLQSNNFIQVHKSFIINSNYIDKLVGNIIYVGSKKIPVGRTYKQDLLTKLKIT